MKTEQLVVFVIKKKTIQNIDVSNVYLYMIKIYIPDGMTLRKNWVPLMESGTRKKNVTQSHRLLSCHSSKPFVGPGDTQSFKGDIILT